MYMRNTLILSLLFALVGGSCSNNSIKNIQQIETSKQAVSFGLPQNISENITLQKKTDYLKESTVNYQIVSIDPAKSNFDLHYQLPPQRLDEWQSQLKKQILVNAAYFDENFNPTGRFIYNNDDITTQNYSSNSAGTVIINNGKLEILNQSEYKKRAINPGEKVFQSFPFLIINSKAQLTEDSHQIARRTILAETDSQLLIIVVDQTAISLYNLMNVLLESDLHIKTALNLDGGQSTGMTIDTNSYQGEILSITPLPLVLSVSVL